MEYRVSPDVSSKEFPLTLNVGISPSLAPGLGYKAAGDH